jgi:hypothetical protein
MWSIVMEKERRHFDSRAIAAILRFCFADTHEVSGHGAEVLPEELLNKLRSFAAGKLKRNTLAIETLAHEIKQHWGQHHNTND